ncbi:hypothetical protein [Tautonia marina]|uniref:hypothetical protein n=1 Tax=Tautonia marina TaxID=2653855 RepID=UPI0012612A9E
MAGRKQHILLDFLGLVIAVVEYLTGVQDCDRFQPLLRQSPCRFLRLRRRLGRGAYKADVDWMGSVSG